MSKEQCACDGSGLRCNACIEAFEDAAIAEATKTITADRDALREQPRLALNEAHAYRENLRAAQERCDALLEEARTARAAERKARALVDIVLRVIPDGSAKEEIANAAMEPK